MIIITYIIEFYNKNFGCGRAVVEVQQWCNCQEEMSEIADTSVVRLLIVENGETVSEIVGEYSDGCIDVEQPEVPEIFDGCCFSS